MIEDSDPSAGERQRAFEEKRRSHHDAARRPVTEKLRTLVALQRRDAAFHGRRRDLAWWERPWPVSPPTIRTDHLREYLDSRSHRIAGLRPKPLILRWLDSRLPHMQVALGIFDRKVEQLMKVAGGKEKIDAWLLSGDKNFAALTAERFILDYLSAKNPGLVQQLGGAGPDATLQTSGATVGIAVTSLNGAIGTWILGERLTEALCESGSFENKRIEIRYSYERISVEASRSSMQAYVRDVAAAVETGDEGGQRALGVRARVEPGHGTVSFDVLDARADWLRLLTSDLEAKLADKGPQLALHPRNLVFIAVNHLPQVWPFPEIFAAPCSVDVVCERPLAQLHEFWREALRRHAGIEGICYFLYALDREGPFYPLRVFWRDERSPVHIDL